MTILSILNVHTYCTSNHSFSLPCIQPALWTWGNERMTDFLTALVLCGRSTAVDGWFASGDASLCWMPSHELGGCLGAPSPLARRWPGVMRIWRLTPTTHTFTHPLTAPTKMGKARRQSHKLNDNACQNMIKNLLYHWYKAAFFILSCQILKQNYNKLNQVNKNMTMWLSSSKSKCCKWRCFTLPWGKNVWADSLGCHLHAFWQILMKHMFSY